METEAIRKVLDDYEALLRGRGDKIHRKWMILNPARASLAALEAENKAQTTRIAELEAEAAAHYQLIKLQRRRMRPAEELWRQATGSPDTTYPDLGGLIEFLLARIAELRAVASELMDWIKNWDVPFLEDDEWDETKARYESALASAPSGMVAVEKEEYEVLRSLAGVGPEGWVAVERERIEARKFEIAQCEGCGEVFDVSSPDAREGSHSVTETVSGPSGDPEPAQAQCGPISIREVVGIADLAVAIGKEDHDG